MRKTLFFDTETTGIQDLYNKTPREQFRLGQWCWGRDGEVFVTTEYDELMEQMESADLLVAHNLFYDTTVMYGKDSTRPLELAKERRLLDTFWWYPLRNRIPAVYETSLGKRATTYQLGKQKPELVKKFLKLGNLNHHHGLSGKEGDLQALAKKYNPPKTLVADLNYGLIPTEDEDYLAYAKQDIIALRELAGFLLSQGPITEYEWNEMLVAAINDQMGKNGFKVDRELAQNRVDELETEKDETMDWLVENFEFPTAGKAPWKSDLGKTAILNAFESFGIVPEGNDDWEKTPTGAPSFSGKVLVPLTEGTEAEKLGRSLGTLQSQRSLAANALDSCWDDGYAHPQVTALQRSGRFSMTHPSLPIWTARGDNAVEKAYFTASPGRKLVEMDYSNADQRIVAALGGDPDYLKRFEPDPVTGREPDGHELSGRLMFGDADYEAEMPEGWETDDKIRKSNFYRDLSKALSHAYAYGAGAKTLARTARKHIPADRIDDAELLRLSYKFIDAMNRAYPWNKAWRERAYQEGLTGEIVDEWGRRLFVDVDRAFTQAPGLLGQAGTRNIMCEGLVRIAFDRPDVLLWLVATVHDAVIWDIPESDLDWAVPYIKSKMEMTFTPKSGIGQSVDFPMSVGKPSDNWFLAGH